MGTLSSAPFQKLASLCCGQLPRQVLHDQGPVLGGQGDCSRDGGLLGCAWEDGEGETEHLLHGAAKPNPCGAITPFRELEEDERGAGGPISAQRPAPQSPRLSSGRSTAPAGLSGPWPGQPPLPDMPGPTGGSHTQTARSLRMQVDGRAVRRKAQAAERGRGPRRCPARLHHSSALSCTTHRRSRP